MKIFGPKSITFFLCLMALFTLSNTPAVKSGPAFGAACILTCCSKVCAGVATACLPLGAATGVLGLFTAAGCFLAAGGGCGVCVSICLGSGLTPIP